MVEIIAEFTTNHMGNLNLLLRMVDKAAEAGASSIKMQCKDVEAFYTQSKLDSVFRSPYGETYRDYRSIFEFDVRDWERFDRRCHAAGIPWFATVQDVPSLEFLTTFCLQRYKVASTNARNLPFLRTVTDQVGADSEIVLSVGGCTLDEIGDALEVFNKHRRVWLLHCVAEYPCADDRTRLGNIVALRRKFGSDRVRIGYSGHEVGYAPTLTAVRLGAEMVERHFCLSRHSFVHHIECSLEPREFADMASKIRRPELSREAFAVNCDSGFGMSEEERAFLVEQTYGNRHLGDHSTM